MNLPNKLTLLRIFLIPVFMLVVLLPNQLDVISILGTPILGNQFLGLLIFIVASITDWLDGHIARSRGLVTNFGKFADPLADKMLVMTALIILVGQHKIASWIVAIIVCRELAVTGLRLLIVELDGEVLAAAWPGKIKTATQMLAIIFLMLNNAIFQNMGIPFANIMVYVSLFFTVYSGIDYFVKNNQVFKHSI